MMEFFFFFFSWLSFALSVSEDKFYTQINGTVVASGTAVMSLTVSINNTGRRKSEAGEGADARR